MKKTIAVVLAVLGAVAAKDGVAGLALPHLVNYVPSQTFVPPGFDDNDRAQVVITGYYPNTCFKQGPTTATVNEVSHQVLIQHQAYHYESSWCLQMLVPYQETVDLGILGSGEYQIYAVDESGKKSRASAISVALAKSVEPDESLYAPVEQAYVEKNAAGGPTLVLGGNFSSPCVQLKEVKLLHRKKDVVEVLPIAVVRETSGCESLPRSFEKRVKLPTDLSGSNLIYIRSLNGNAVTRVVEF